MGFGIKGGFGFLGGWAFQTTENFNSIPGLVAYWDSLFRITTVGGDVRLIGDGSGNNLNLSKNISSTLTTSYSGGIITQNNLTAGLRSQFTNTQANLNFLENGSNFGIFGCNKIKFGTQSSNIEVRAIASTSQGIGGGSRTIWTSQNRSLRFQVTQELGSSLLSVETANNTIPDDEKFTWGVVRRAVSCTNNFQLFINNAVTNRTNANFQYPTQVRNVFNYNLLTNTLDHRIDSGFAVVYNWTGFTEAQVNGFVNRLRVLVEQRRNLYDM